MSPNWQSLCRDGAFRIAGNKIEVMLDKGRHQFVEVHPSDDEILLYSVVARPAAVAQFENAALRAWKRNRAVPLVSFRVDDRGRMISESWVPTCGLTREEFQLHVRTIAIESDRFEFQITGKDIE